METVGLFDFDMKAGELYKKPAFSNKPRPIFPNLALMKLSAHYKSELPPYPVKLNTPGDLNYGSCVFDKNRLKAQAHEGAYKNIKVGGWGSDNKDLELPRDIEHLCPDYDLYGFDFSIGFTTRGCPKNCPFCVVPGKEGPVVEASPLSEFVRHRKVTLLDNNILALPSAAGKLLEMADRDLTVDFQGLDAQYITEDLAWLLKRVKVEKHYRLAWDQMSDEGHVRRGIKLLNEAGIRPGSIMVYVLVGYNTSWDEDWFRFKELEALGVLPYIMLFSRHDKLYNIFSLFVNMGYYRRVSWDEYWPRVDQGDQGLLDINYREIIDES